MATLIFFSLVGALNEVFVAQMEWAEVVRARIAGVPLLVVSGAFYGAWRDMVLTAIRFERLSQSSRIASEAVTLLSFRLPIYMLMIIAGGASGTELSRGAAGAAVILLLSGRPCGLWIDFVRTAFGVSPRSAG